MDAGISLSCVNVHPDQVRGALVKNQANEYLVRTFTFSKREMGNFVVTDPYIPGNEQVELLWLQAQCETLKEGDRIVWNPDFRVENVFLQIRQY